MVSQVLFCWKGLKKIETGMDMLLGKRLFAYFFFLRILLRESKVVKSIPDVLLLMQDFHEFSIRILVVLIQNLKQWQNLLPESS